MAAYWSTSGKMATRRKEVSAEGRLTGLQGSHRSLFGCFPGLGFSEVRAGPSAAALRAG